MPIVSTAACESFQTEHSFVKKEDFLNPSFYIQTYWKVPFNTTSITSADDFQIRHLTSRFYANSNDLSL